jgi:hypothetical protein
VTAALTVQPEALHPVEPATTLRIRNGRLWATDGSFARTPEQLAGFVLVEVRDLNAAIQLAARNPAARYGTVEIRPIRECGVGVPKLTSWTSPRGVKHECK